MKKDTRRALAACDAVGMPFAPLNNYGLKFQLYFPDEDGDQQTTINGYEMGDTFVVAFDVDAGSWLSIMHSPHNISELDGGFTGNTDLVLEAQRIAPKLTEALSEFLMGRVREGMPPYKRTVYTGFGLGGALATMMSLIMVPHALITFGTDAFVNERYRDLFIERVGGLMQRYADQGKTREFSFLNYQMADDARTQSAKAPLVHLGQVVWWNPLYGWELQPFGIVRRGFEFYCRKRRDDVPLSLYRERLLQQ